MYETMSFQPWKENFSRGWYLAGIEVYQEAEARGWVKWIMPAPKYLMKEVQMERYMEIFTETLKHTISENGWKLCGAVCDFTEMSTGKNKLFFPVGAI